VTGASLAPHPLDPDFEADEFHRNPYRHHAAWRNNTPVFRNRDGVVYLTRYRDVEFLLTNKQFRRQPPGGGLSPFEPRQEQEANAIERMISHWMIFMDPPRHDIVRQGFSAPFSAKTMRLLEPAIRRAARHLIERWDNNRPLELVSGFASPLPIFVLCEILGIPSADWPHFDVWSSKIMHALDTGSADTLRAAVPTGIEIRDYFTGLLRERAAHPREDFLGNVITTARAARLTDDEIIYGTAFLLLAGHETTKNLIASGVLTLADQPDQAQLLRQEPALIESAIEELLRFQSPLQKVSRWAHAPARFGDYEVDAGTLVTALIGAANRDPAVFANPDRFDVRRNPNRHLAFGRGTHVCLGTTLARLESRIAFGALLEALPEFKVLAHQWRLKSAFRALETLTLSPERR